MNNCRREYETTPAFLTIVALALAAWLMAAYFGLWLWAFL